jgi:hypothetical protein
MVSSIRAWFSRYRFPVLAAICLRAATSLWMAFVWLFLDPYFPRTALSYKETYGHLSAQPSLIGRMFLDVWLRWDAVHYMNLAWGGYENAASGDMSFWPLYPYLVRAISFLTPHETVLAGLLVSTIATIISAVLFWDLVQTLFQDTRLANGSVLAWLIFPTAFFLVAPFSDSLFACLALACFCLMVRKRWILAGVFIALGGLARSQGILLMAPLFLAIALDTFSTRNKPSLAAIAGLGIAPLGSGLFLLWRQSLNLPDIFTSYNVYSAARIVNPLLGFWLAVERVVQYPDLLAITEILSVLLFLAALSWMLTKPIFRKEIPLMVYGFLTILFILIKINLKASPIQSADRYVLHCIPAFIGFAYLVLSLPEKARRLIILLSVILGMVVNTLYAMWVFVG